MFPASSWKCQLTALSGRSARRSFASDAATSRLPDRTAAFRQGPLNQITLRRAAAQPPKLGLDRQQAIDTFSVLAVNIERHRFDNRQGDVPVRRNEFAAVCRRDAQPCGEAIVGGPVPGPQRRDRCMDFR